MTDAKLKECPFCGRELRRNMSGWWEDTNRECILFGLEFSNKVIPAWNTRKPMERIVEKLEEKAKEPMYQHDGEDYFVGVESAIEIVKGGGVDEVG